MLEVFEMFHKQTSTDQGILLKRQLNTVKCLSFPEQNGLVFITMTGIQLTFLLRSGLLITQPLWEEH